MYRIIKSKTDKEIGIEARLAKISAGYSVGVFDLDCNEYYPPIKIFPYRMENALEKAKASFSKLIGEIRK